MPCQPPGPPNRTRRSPCSIDPPIHPLIRAVAPTLPPRPRRSRPQSLNSQPATLNFFPVRAKLFHFPQIIKLAANPTCCSLATSKVRIESTPKFQFWRQNPPQPPASPRNPPEPAAPLISHTYPRWDILTRTQDSKRSPTVVVAPSRTIHHRAVGSSAIPGFGFRIALLPALPTFPPC